MSSTGDGFGCGSFGRITSPGKGKDTTTRGESDQGGDSSDPWEDFESDEDEEEQPFQKGDDGNDRAQDSQSPEDAPRLQDASVHDNDDQADPEDNEDDRAQDARSLREESIHDPDDFLILSDDEQANQEDAHSLQEAPIPDAGNFVSLSGDDNDGPEGDEEHRNDGQPESPKAVQKKRKNRKNTSDPSKPFKCPVSGCRLATAGYPRADHQRRHMYEHLKVKPYKCQELYCSYECRRKDKIKDHLISKHKMPMETAKKGADASATAAIPEINLHKPRIHIWVNTGVDPGPGVGEAEESSDEADEADAGGESGSEVAEHYRRDSAPEDEEGVLDEEERNRLMDLQMTALEEASSGVSSDGERDYGEEPSSDADDLQGGAKRKRSFDGSDDDDFAGKRGKMV